VSGRGRGFNWGADLVGMSKLLLDVFLTFSLVKNINLVNLVFSFVILSCGVWFVRRLGATLFFFPI